MNKKVIFTIAPMALVMGALTGCKGGDTPTSKTLTNIKVTPTMSKYAVGYKFTDFDIGSFQAYYSDGSTVPVKEGYTSDPTLPYTFKDDDVEKGKDFNFTYQGKSASFHVDVVKTKTLDSISATCSKAFKVNDTLNKDDIAVTAKYSDQTTEKITDWTCDLFKNDQYTFVDADVGEKEFTINYKDKTTSVKVKVDSSVIHVTGVSVKESTSIEAGKTETLTATITPSDATNKNVTWSSDKTSVATVDATTGLVSAVAQGSAKITVTTEDGSFTDTCEVTVTPAVTPYNIDWNTTKFDLGDGTAKTLYEYAKTATKIEFIEDSTVGDHQVGKTKDGQVYASWTDADGVKELKMWGSKKIIFDNSDTPKSGFFGECSNVTEFNFANVDTSGLDKMTNMFNGCSSLTTLDISKFNFNDSLTDISNMFNGCSKLESIYVSEKTDLSKLKADSTNMFNGCESLIGLNDTKYDTNHLDKTYARVDGGTSNPGYFSYIDELPFYSGSRVYIKDISSLKTTKHRYRAVIEEGSNIWQFYILDAGNNAVQLKQGWKIYIDGKDSTDLFEYTSWYYINAKNAEKITGTGKVLIAEVASNSECTNAKAVFNEKIAF